MASVTLVTVAHLGMNGGTLKRISDAQDSLLASGMDGRVCMIDNSPRDSNWPIQCQWTQGYNIGLGGAMSLVLENIDTDFTGYFCANHGEMIDRGWLPDAVAALESKNATYGIAGDRRPCNYEYVRHFGDPELLKPHWHIQGGVWLARTDALKKVGFCRHFPQCLCDVSLSYRMVLEGYHLADVPSISSVASPGESVSRLGQKYIHDYT